MEHNDGEQNMDTDQQMSWEHHLDDGDASASLVSNVLALLGLEKAGRVQGMEEAQLLRGAREYTTDDVEGTQAAQLEALLQALKDEHSSVRAVAARALGMLGSRTPIEPLVAALGDSEWSVRAAAALALGKLDGRTPIEPLVATLNDLDASVRVAATWSLGTLEKQAPVEPLVDALNDPDWLVREAAALALGKLGERTPVGPLLAARLDEDASVREAAELVLQRIYPRLSTDTVEVSTATTVEQEIGPRPPVQSNGHIDKRKFSWRQLIAPRRRPFPHLAAAALAVLVIVGTVFSWLAASYSLLAPVSSHPTPVIKGMVVTYHGGSGQVYQVAWSPDGKNVASVHADGSVRVWDAFTGNTISNYKGSFIKVLSMVWASPHSLLVTSQAEDRRVQVWDVLARKSLLTTTPLPGLASSSAWSPDGRSIALDGGNNTVQVWSIDSGKLVLTYRGHTGRVTALSWSPDGSEIASASDDTTIQVWNAATGHKDWPSFVHNEAVTAVAWSPDGKHCAVATVRGLVEVWDNPSWQNTSIAPTNNDWSDLSGPFVTSIVWSPDGTRFAFTTASGLVQVWDTETVQRVYTYAGHAGQVNIVAWSPDGTRLASASNDGTVQVWPNPSFTENGRFR